MERPAGSQAAAGKTSCSLEAPDEKYWRASTVAYRANRISGVCCIQELDNSVSKMRVVAEALPVIRARFQSGAWDYSHHSVRDSHRAQLVTCSFHSLPLTG